jgi:hypothetical protein
MLTKLRLLATGLLLVGYVLLGTASPALSDYEQSVVVSPDSALTVVRNDPDAVPNTFLWIKNPSPTKYWHGKVKWFDASPMAPGDTVEGGYQLLDTTLRITWDNPWDTNTTWPKYGRGIGWYQRQLDARRLSPATLMIMRKGGTVWSRGVRKIRELGRADIRRVNGPMDRELGHYGVDMGSQYPYAWAVVDQPGDYVLGGMPEPSTLALLACGLAAGGLVALRRRRSRKA